MGFGARMGTMGATRWSAKCCGYTAERANKGGERPEAIIEPAIAKTARTGSREALARRVWKSLWNCRHLTDDTAVAYRMTFACKPGSLVQDQKHRHFLSSCVPEPERHIPCVMELNYM